VLQDFVELPATMASGAVVLPMHDRKFSLESSWFGTSNMYNATKFQVQIASTH
jgi:hypothetical protein